MTHDPLATIALIWIAAACVDIAWQIRFTWFGAAEPEETQHIDERI